MKLQILVGLIALTTFTQGCLNSKTGKPTIAASNPEGESLPHINANMYPVHKVVCDPWEPNDPGPNDGLVAQLYYRGQGQPDFPNVQSYIDSAIKSNKYLFFSDLNVPTRIFSLGFPTQTGGVVQNDMNENLNEYFALRFQSVFKLSAGDEEGDYEFALLSDDGAMMRMKQDDNSFKVIVENDGHHPTRMGCGTQIVPITKESEILVQMDYYQGPRHHIAMIPMFRKVNGTPQAEPLCGVTGNETYFNYNNNSSPQQPYLALLDRGWKPIAAANWHLPASSVVNPCTPGTPPVISNFKLVRSEEGFMTFSWTTNVPATSQIFYKNVASGEEALTTSDNVMRTSHQISVYLQIGQVYDFQAVSISSDYGKGYSNTLRLTVN